MKIINIIKGVGTQLRSLGMVFSHAWSPRETLNYPEQAVYAAPRYRGRIVRINFSRCIFCGLCEEACPTTAIQLTPDFEMGEYRRQDLVYEKEDLLISGPGKYPDYNFYRMSGMAIDGKPKGDAENEAKPIDVKSLLP